MVEHKKPCVLFDLPPELLAHVFLVLPWKQLVLCRVVCKRFHEIITSSTEINYKIELAIAGYQNGPSLCQTPLSERLQRLRQTQKGWLGLNFKRRQTIELEKETPTYELQGSVFLRGRGRSSAGSNSTAGISGYIMASALTGDEMHQWTVECFAAEVRDFTLDPLQDLLVLIEEKQVDIRGLMLVSLRFRSLLINRPHPIAQHEVVSMLVSGQPRGYGITVVNQFVFLFNVQESILVWNWVTGQCHAKLNYSSSEPIIDVIPLQRTTFMAIRLSREGPKLEVYTFSTRPPDAEFPPPILRAVYLPPLLQRGVQMAMRCRCDPPPLQYSDLIQPKLDDLPIPTPSYLKRPFQINETSRILAFGIQVWKHAIDPADMEFRDIALFAPPDTFLPPGLDPEAPSGDPLEIPAAEWMRKSRIISDLPLRRMWVCYIYGTRFAALGRHDPDQSSSEESEEDLVKPKPQHLYIYDFNAEAIARLAQEREQDLDADFDFESNSDAEDDSGRKMVIEWTDSENKADIKLVIGEDELSADEFFKEPLRCEAPYMVSKAKEPIEVGHDEHLEVMIDDERMILVRLKWDAQTQMSDPGALEVYTI